MTKRHDGNAEAQNIAESSIDVASALSAPLHFKAKTAIHSIDKAQHFSHRGLSVGLLLNFHEVKLVDGVHRIVNDFREHAR